MGLAERCDEIVRLIDETLAGLGVDPPNAVGGHPTPPATPIAGPDLLLPDPDATAPVS